LEVLDLQAVVMMHRRRKMLGYPMKL